MSGIAGYRLSPQQAALARHVGAERSHPFGSLLQLKLQEPMAPEALAARLARLIADAEILRTRLEAVPGLAQPVQVIEPEALLPLKVEDLRGLDVDAQQQRLAAFAHLPRTWEQPLSVTLLWLADGEQALELAAEATHADLASLRCLARALTDDGTALAELQYADYAEWKWSLAESPEAAAGARHWAEATAGAGMVPRLALETPSGGDGRLAVHEIALPPALAGHPALNPTLMLAAWAGVLSRLTGQAEVPLALIDEGRGEGLDAALGLFEQPLPLLLSLHADRPLAAQCGAVDEAMELAAGWRDACTVGVPAGYAFAQRSAALSGELQALGCSHAAKACLEVTTTPSGWRCRLVVDAAVLDDRAALCLAQQWLTLLAAAVETLDTPLAEVPLLDDTQHTFIAPAPHEPPIEPVSIVELIARQMRENPDAPAVSDPQRTLRYAGLDAHAQHLARRLVAAGVKPGEPVGILLPRGTQMIVAILGVLRAGAAYVPLDPAYPEARREHMVQDSGMRHLVTETALLPQAPAQVSALLVESSEDADAALPAIALDAPAYLIYTSGSTGKPKAVEIHHGALSHSTQLRFAVYREPVRAYLLLSSFAFDSSVAGIFWTLAQGGCLVLPAPGDELAIDRLAALIEQHRVSHGLSLPSLYEALLDQAPAAQLQSLSTWIVAGEACPATLPTRHAQVLPEAELVNEYGPTEATVWATVDVLAPGRDVTIGRPLPTMGLQLLTEHGVPAAIGEAGEVVLSGRTLARGYRGRPDETARAFAPLADGTRAYRTGDLACWRPDGRLAFLGRKDHQVKLRGYRIELGEIERRLREHPGMRDAAAVVRELAAGKQLVAYVIPRIGEAPSAEMLKRFVAEQLPQHMVPAQCVSLAAFPRTPNGKLDVQALPDPDAAQRTCVAPRNAVETALAEIVATVLRRSAVGVLDNFFEIGGDSILSLQLVARARERGIALSAKQVFEHQTIAAMAEAAERVAPEASPPIDSKPFAAADLSDNELQSLIAEIGAGR